MDIELLTDQLHRIRETGQAYRFIEQSHNVLARVPHAPRLALLTLESLVELGFGGPARELLQIRRDLDYVDPRVAEHRDRALAGPNGRVAWNALRDRLDRNVAALLRHRPHLAPLTASLAGLLRSVNLYQSVAGAYCLSTRQAGGLRQWWPALTHREEDARVELPPRGELGATVVIGARISPLLQRAYRDTHKLFLTYSQPLYLVEPDPAYFAAWLHCADVESYLDDERVYVLAGAGAVDGLEQLLVDEPGLAIPAICVNQSADPGVAARATQAAERASQRRVERLTVLAAELRERYRRRDTAFCAARLRPPGVVLAVTSRFTTVLQYSTRDTLHALEAMGYATCLVVEERDHHQLSSLNVCRAVLDHDPVMILILDHLRYEYPHLPAHLPFLTWIQDAMPNLLCPRAGESVGRFDFVCGYFRDRCITEFGYPADAFAYADIPVSTAMFDDAELAEEVHQRYACDISFVSNGSTPIERFHLAEAAAYPPEWRPMLDKIFGRVLELLRQKEHPRLSDLAADLVREAAEKFGASLSPIQSESVTTNYAYRLLDWGRRQQTLEWVADWAKRTGRTLRIYGRGWERHPTLSEFAAGVLEHGEPLRAAYRASKLALQLIPSGFWHQRSYELLAAGTLPLTRHCPDDFDFLPMAEFIRRRDVGERLGGAAARFPQLERIVFRTPAEFEALAEAFLRDDSRRAAVRNELRNVVLREYTYDAVVRRVISSFQDRLNNAAGVRSALPPASMSLSA